MTLKKAVLLYYSIHHDNTQKIAEAIADKLPVDLVRIPAHAPVHLEDYDLVGFASGIYMSEFGKPLQRLAMELDGLNGTPCFTLYTCGAPRGEYAGPFASLLQSRGANIVGGWHCRGFDTFGPFKLIGGLAKGRPNADDLADAVAFVEALLAD